MSAALAALELELLEAAVRAKPARVAALLDEEFVEFGSSGRVWDRVAIVAGLAAERGDARRRAEDMRVRMLAPDVGLVTYRAVRESEGGCSPACAARSGCGGRGNGGWRSTRGRRRPDLAVS